MVIAEVSIFPLGTGTPSVSEYVSAAVRELEASGLKCTLGRAYTVIKMDERRDVEGRSTEDMMRSVRAQDDR